MTDPDSDRATLEEILYRRGLDFLREAIERGNRQSPIDELTIVCNAGVHPLPADYIFGELYVASRGNLDFSDIDSVNAEYDIIIAELHRKLVEKTWKKIYLVPFGHSTLCMNIKLAVYRTLRIETIDVFYFGNGRYGLLEREMRKVLTR